MLLYNYVCACVCVFVCVSVFVCVCVWLHSHTYIYIHAYTQTYYSNFLESAIYLRFLNELVHMLNASSVTMKTLHTKPSLKPVPEWRDDLDNPDSLWQRERLP